MTFITNIHNECLSIFSGDAYKRVFHSRKRPFHSKKIRPKSSEEAGQALAEDETWRDCKPMAEVDHAENEFVSTLVDGACFHYTEATSSLNLPLMSAE